MHNRVILISLCLLLFVLLSNCSNHITGPSNPSIAVSTQGVDSRELYVPEVDSDKSAPETDSRERFVPEVDSDKSAGSNFEYRNGNGNNPADGGGG